MASRVCGRDGGGRWRRASGALELAALASLKACFHPSARLTAFWVSRDKRTMEGGCAHQHHSRACQHVVPPISVYVLSVLTPRVLPRRA